jgi:hypothetical protein
MGGDKIPGGGIDQMTMTADDLLRIKALAPRRAAST